MQKVDSRIKWKAVQALSKMFWDCFVKKYSPFLKIPAKWNEPTRTLTLNDMVLAKDDNLTRLRWKLGRVIEDYTGGDGAVRSVKVKLSETTLIRLENTFLMLENVKWEVKIISFSLGAEGVLIKNWNNLNLIICFVTVLWYVIVA